jgi:hypothetical protein
MNIFADEELNINLTKVYNPVILKTDEGFELSICMRDWGYDIIIPKLEKHIHINDSGKVLVLREGKSNE